jgi:hypothetical protein
MGTELTNTAKIIPRSGIFDEVDSKYGIPEEERQKIDAEAAAGGEDGGMDMPPPASGGGGDAAGEPLSETRKIRMNNLLGESTDISDLFDLEKAKKNIYEIENKIKDILNQ